MTSSCLARPEVELLLHCARAQVEPERAERIADLAHQPLDWGYLMRLAGRNEVTSLLYWHLARICRDALPEAVLAELRDRFEANARNSLMLTADLLEVLALLEASGIAAIPLKGPVFASSLYGNLALREFVDLDILVRRQDVLRAKALLGVRGYAPRVSLTPAQDDLFVDQNCEYELFREEAGDKRLLELHWEFVPRYFAIPLDMTGLWERAGTVSLAGRSLPSLSPEDLLLVSAIHSGKHLWQSFKTAADLAEIIRKQPSLGWDRLLDQTRALGCARVLRVSLLLAADLLDAPLPARVLDWARADSSAAALAERSCGWMLGDVVDLKLVPQHAWRLRTRERLVDRVRYLYRIATMSTTEEYRLVALPRALSSLYVLLRPFRLAAKYGPGLFR